MGWELVAAVERPWDLVWTIKGNSRWIGLSLNALNDLKKRFFAFNRYFVSFSGSSIIKFSPDSFERPSIYSEKENAKSIEDLMKYFGKEIKFTPPTFLFRVSTTIFPENNNSNPSIPDFNSGVICRPADPLFLTLFVCFSQWGRSLKVWLQAEG